MLLQWGIELCSAKLSSFDSRFHLHFHLDSKQSPFLSNLVAREELQQHVKVHILDKPKTVVSVALFNMPITIAGMDYFFYIKISAGWKGM